MRPNCLGVTIRSDLSFASHIEDITKKATKNLWLLLRFRDMGASTEQLLTLWHQKGRSILEFASPVFFSSLTIEQNDSIESCQRKAFAIIPESKYESYEAALKNLQQEHLSVRREAAAIKFAQKCLDNPKHSDMFPRNPPVKYSIRNRKPFKEYDCSTDRMYKSSLPTITRLLNKKH